MVVFFNFLSSCNLSIFKMPTICCAIGCKHLSGNGYCRLKRFPSDAERSTIWERNVRRSKWIRKDWELICECHFHFSQFEKLREDGAKKLKHNAVPTLFPTHTVPLPDGVGASFVTYEKPSSSEQEIIKTASLLESLVPVECDFGGYQFENDLVDEIKKLPSDVPCMLSSHTIDQNEVHFEESAFESHRADGLRKLKPNAVPTIHNFSQNKRKRRKQCVKPRVEFTFGEGDSESLVLAEKLISNSNEGDPIKISEIYYSQLGDDDTPPQNGKKLKTIHVTEIVSSRVQEGGSENKRVESYPIYSTVDDDEQIQSNELQEKEAKDTPVVKGKRGRPFKKRRKRRNLMKDQNNSPTKEIMNDLEENKKNVEVDMEHAIPILEREDSTVECFVCNQIILSSSAVHLKVPTEATRILLVHRLETIADLEGVIDEQEVVCRRCASLLNHIDRTEAELFILKGAISTCVRGRFIDGKAVSNTEFVNNLQLLDRFESIAGEPNNILSLDELYFMKAEKEDAAENRVSNDRDTEVLSDEGSMQEVFLEDDLKIETEENVTDNERDEYHQLSPLDNYAEATISSEFKITDSPVYADENQAVEKSISKEDTNIPNTSLKNNSCRFEIQSNNPDLGTKSKFHVCKICAFKSQHDSVMIWHLRMHMRNGRWCDFCNASIPEQESVFSRLKKNKALYKSQRRKTVLKSKQPIVLPSISVDPVHLPTFPLSSYPLTVIPIPNITTSAPVLLISKENSDIKKVVSSSSASVDQSHNQEAVSKLVTDCGVLYGNSDNALISGISLLPDKEVMPKVDIRISCAKENQVQKQFFIQVNPTSKRVDETHSLERFSGIQDSAAISLGDAGSSVTIGEEFNESMSNCSNLVGDGVMETYNSLQEQNDIVTNESVHDDFVDESSECIKPDNLHSEVFCEGGVESSFLDTLPSQPATKFVEILPEICDESADQNVMTISNDTSEVNITNKDVSFARSDGLGESELAIAYENSVAALMCQSDDSETMLSYH